MYSQHLLKNFESGIKNIIIIIIIIITIITIIIIVIITIIFKFHFILIYIKYLQSNY